jgi:phage terminase small subunit
MEEFEGAGRDRVFVGFVKKYRLADKNAALDKAAKIAGLYELDNKQARTVVSIRDLTGRK